MTDGRGVHVRPSSTPAADRSRSPAAHFAAPARLSGCWRFYRAAAEAQVPRCLPRMPSRLLDLPSPAHQATSRAVAAGHDVVALLPDLQTRARRPLTLVNGRSPLPRTSSPGRLRHVVGASVFLRGFASDAFDGVLADERGRSRDLG